MITAEAHSTTSHRKLTLAGQLAFIPTGVLTTLLGPMLPILIARWAMSDTQAGNLFLVQFLAQLAGVQLSAVLLARVGFQESARRTPEGAYRDAFLLRDLRAPEPGLLGRSLDPGVDLAHGAVDLEEKPLYHLAVALGTPSRFRAHVPTSKTRMGVQ